MVLSRPVINPGEEDEQSVLFMVLMHVHLVDTAIVEAFVWSQTWRSPIFGSGCLDNLDRS